MKTFFRYLAALFFIVAGVNHFRDPSIYRDMMPPWLPWHEELIALSGAAEILGGLGLVPRFSRKAAAWGLIALLVAVFPANVHLARNGWPGIDIPAWVLWARLPLQPLMILWVYQTSLRPPQFPNN